jgi:hypothetical protein
MFRNVIQVKCYNKVFGNEFDVKDYDVPSSTILNFIDGLNTNKYSTFNNKERYFNKSYLEQGWFKYGYHTIK